MPPRSITILGGGLSGLSSAIYLSRRFPAAQIFLLERQNRLGGWVRSERVELPQIGASVLLEAGPRTLRPNGKSVLEMINILNLEDKIIIVPKTAPPARARFLYIPESYGGSATGLQRLPSSIFSLLFSPLLSDMLPHILREPFTRANRPLKVDDESLDSFLSRRFGPNFARTFGSALVHGVYATDSQKLSVKAAFPTLWRAEERGRGSIVRGFLTPARKLKDGEESYELGRLPDMMRETAVFSFKDGMETLTQAMEQYLRSAQNITILKNTRVSDIKLLDDQSVKISHSSGEPINATHVVSALPLPVLHDLISSSSSGSGLKPKNSLPFSVLRKNPTSSVQVVNFVFPGPPASLHPEGFGYLIPRPPNGYPLPSGSSGIGVLGAVFDSCSLHEQDRPQMEDYYNQAPHTKLTMMTGGPYPAPQPPLPPKLCSSESGDEDTPPPFIRFLLDQLKVQLGHDVPNPLYWRIWNNEACIPTLLPDHLKRMEELKEVLKGDDAVAPGWGGRLAIIGAGVGGVSVPDCIEAGRRVGRDWA